MRQASAVEILGIAGYLITMWRPASLAGQWYPESERACRAAIETHAALARPEQGPWRGLVGPHAGWVYSGDAAGRAYAWLGAQHPDADLVVIFGSHRGAHGPNTILREEGWETPLGKLSTAADLVSAIDAELELQEEPGRPRHPDNAVEVHLPFVRYFFPKAELVMLGVAAAPSAFDLGRRVGDIVAASGRRAVFIGSTDLTHYGPNYRFEPHGPGAHGVSWVREVNDRGYLDRVLANDALGALEHATREQSACCPGAVAACMGALGEGAPKLLDHYLSSDVRPSSSFVGYAGILL